jgi:excisionase family DNA binding protein
MMDQREIARQESFRWASEAPVPQFMTLQDFSKLTATAENTIRQWIRQGKLRAVTANGGHSLRIPVTEVTRIFKPLKPSKNPEGQWDWNDDDVEAPMRT